VEAYCVVCPIMVMGSNPARFEGGLKLKCICLHTDCFVFEGKQIRWAFSNEVFLFFVPTYMYVFTYIGG
jgi:hypothetical protein